MAELVGVTCDGPRCKRGYGDTTMTIIVPSNTSPDALPDAYFRFILRHRFEVPGKAPKAYHFCSNDCERDFIRDEAVPLSPREQREQDDNNKRVEMDKAAKTSPSIATASASTFKVA